MTSTGAMSFEFTCSIQITIYEYVDTTPGMNFSTKKVSVTKIEEQSTLVSLFRSRNQEVNPLPNAAIGKSVIDHSSARVMRKQ